MKAVIIAGGLGTRLGLETIPKPMYKINGRPVLEHNILLLKNHGIKDICIALHYMPEIIKSFFCDGKTWGVNITYLIEEKPLGTAGAIKNAEVFLGEEPFFVIYGDNFTNINLSEMLKSHLSSKPIVTIGIFNPEKSINSRIAGGFVITDKENNIVSFVEGEKIHSSDYEAFVNAGIYVMEHEVLKMIPTNKPDEKSDFGKDIFPKLIEEGYLLKGYLTDGFVIAIDTKDALAYAEEIIQTGEIIK